MGGGICKKNKILLQVFNVSVQFAVRLLKCIVAVLDCNGSGRRVSVGKVIAKELLRVWLFI
jgi:hypothetical protein